MDFEPTQPAQAVNPDAGDHEITADPAALAACTEAIARTYATFPYFAVRYGDRGRKFSSSDSGWLITLTDLGIEEATKQVLWLGAVLAARGMPRWHLEVHLTQLADALATHRPDARREGVLRECAADLRVRRTRRVSEPAMAGISAGFDARVGGAERALLPGTGAWLAAAVADEADRLANAVDSVVTWLADPARFTPEWVAAVHGAVAEARAAVNP